VRPRLRNDVRYVQCPEGAYVHGLDGACTVKGAHSYEWLSRLAPYLTGEHTLDDLVESLPVDRRAMVEGLVSALFEQGFVVDAVGDEPHGLDAEEQRVYAAEIAFIRYRLASAERRFQRVREARIVLIGQGPVVGAVLEAGLWSGWCTVGVLAPAAQLAALRETAEVTRRDPKQVVRLQLWSEGPEAEVIKVVDEADVVLQICHESHQADLLAVSRACVGVGVALGQVLVGDDEVWLTPVGPPQRIEAESCWRRLAAQNRSHPDASPGELWLIGPVPTVVAAQLALCCFSYLTGLDTLPSPQRAAQPPLLTRVDLRTLVTSTHRVRPHPLAKPQPAQTPADAQALLEELARGAPVEAADLLDRVTGVIDARTGLLGALDEEDFTQVPLSACRARVSDPYSVLPAWAPAPTVTGWGNDRSTARLQALLAALATYATLTPGVISSQQQCWGLDLVTGALRVVPATVVYPVLGDAPVPYQAPVGAAAGRCWTDAIAAGLRAHCEALLVQRYETGQQRCPRRDVAQILAEVSDDHATHLLRLLHAVDRRLTVTDLGSILGLPAFAVQTGADPVVVACAATVVEALCDGLERAVLYWQAGSDGQLACGNSAVLWPAERHASRVEDPRADPLCRALIDALHRAGRVPVAVPIGHDRQARGLLPYVVQVVLCDD